MIRKVYQIDPLTCPQCGGRMRIISFIEDHKVIDKIIAHLKLTFHAERPPPPQFVQKELLMAAEETLMPTAWHEIDADKVVCRQRELMGKRVNVRELVLSKNEGLIRDSTYSIRIYKPEELAMLMEKAGFKKVKVQNDFRVHQEKGDYGFMNSRMLAIGRKL